MLKKDETGENLGPEMKESRKGVELADQHLSRKKTVVCVNVRHDPRSFGPIKLAAPPLVI